VGTREAEQLVAATFSQKMTTTKETAATGTSGIGWRVVSEAGASVYSASELAGAEVGGCTRCMQLTHS
jgi:transcriptional accessory protein Tex/SPT6